MSWGMIDDRLVKNNSAATGDNTKEALDGLAAHATATNNPHGVTAAQAGAIPVAQKGTPNGVASLDGSGKVPASQLPPLAIGKLEVVANQTARFALTTADVQNGDLVKQSDTNTVYMVIDDEELGSEDGYSIISSPGGGVDTFEGRAGAVVAAAGDYDASQVTNDSSVAGDFVDDALNNLSSALTGKANATHTHSAADITSGTLDVARIPTGIPATSIGSGAISNTEFGYLDGVTSGIQGQLDALKLPTYLDATPTGTANGTNTDFTVTVSATTATANPGETEVYLEHVWQEPGVDYTWQSSNTVVRFTRAPATGMRVRVRGRAV